MLFRSEAKKYFEQNGNLEVPTKYKTEQGYSLGHWLSTQRKVRRGEQFGILGEERIEKLDSIGMVWESHKDLSWNKYYGAAKEYYAEHGNLKVPAPYITKSGIRIGAWIANLRTYRKIGAQSSYLTKERIAALDSIGMIWDVADMLWERNFGAAKTYCNERGNLDVPFNYVTNDGIKLGVWIINLRNSYLGKNKSYKLTQRQIDALNEIGMIWQLRNDRAWERGYEYAVAYYTEHKNLDVPTTYTTDNGYRLGAWICDQRERKDKLSAERKSKLNALGMIWQKPDSWEVRYELAEAYYEEHGNLKMPGNYISNGIWLNKWLSEQRLIYMGRRSGKQLTQEQINKLAAIGAIIRPDIRVMDERKITAVGV